MAARFCSNCGRPLTETERQGGVTICGACAESAGGVPAAPVEESASAGFSSSHLDYHVTGQRIVAALIDIALLVILFLVMAALMGESGSTDGGGFEVRLENGPFILYLLLSIAYFVILEGLTGATLGKMAMGLRVSKLDGEPYGWGAVLLRNVLRIIDGFPLLYLVGIVCIAATEQNQRIGDLAARTTVVRAR